MHMNVCTWCNGLFPTRRQLPPDNSFYCSTGCIEAEMMFQILCTNLPEPTDASLNLIALTERKESS